MTPDAVPRASNPPSRPEARAPTGWRSRGYLPHFDGPGAVQHVIFRLAGALPASVMRTVEQSPRAARFQTAETALDEGHGEPFLHDPRIAKIVEDALLHFDGSRYRLLAWCIMPTHVHVLIEQAEEHSLSGILHSWKPFTANAANKLLQRSDPFWAPEYYDRFMRDSQQLEATAAYIEANPVRARLCESPADWRFSSASAANVLRASSPPNRPQTCTNVPRASSPLSRPEACATPPG